MARVMLRIGVSVSHPIGVGNEARLIVRLPSDVVPNVENSAGYGPRSGVFGPLLNVGKSWCADCSPRMLPER